MKAKTTELSNMWINPINKLALQCKIRYYTYMSTDNPTYEEIIADLFPPIVPDEIGMVWVGDDAVIIDLEHPF